MKKRNIKIFIAQLLATLFFIISTNSFAGGTDFGASIGEQLLQAVINQALAPSTNESEIVEHNFANQLQPSQNTYINGTQDSTNSDPRFGNAQAPIPDELILLVLDNLSLQELANLSSTSSAWNNIANDPVLWKMKTEATFDKGIIIKIIEKYFPKTPSAELNWKKIYIICFLLSQSLPNFITNTAQLNESMKILTALRKYDLITPDFYTSFLNTIKIGIEGTEYHDSLRQAALAIYNLACEDKMDTKDVKSAFIHAVNFMFEGLPMEKK